MDDSNNLRNFSLFLSGLILVHSILFLKLGAPGLFLFCGVCFLLIIVNALHIRKDKRILAGHVLNVIYLIYVIVLCHKTGGFYSVLIFMLFFTPVLTTVFPGKKEKIGYSSLALCAFLIFSFGQGFPLVTAMPEKLVNLSYFRFVHLFALFVFFNASILLIIAEKGRIQGLLNHAEEEKNRIEEDSKTAMKIKNEFLANMSHEIRNPMNGIIGMMHVLLDSDLNEDQRKYSQIVYNSAMALLTIVNDILDLSKIKAGKLELDIRDFDLEVSIKDIVALPELQARQKGIDFIYSIDPDVPCLLQGDIGRIRQVINNFTGNAIKFTDQGQVILSIKLKSDDKSFATLYFSVEDTGIGIKEEVIGSLFESFTQADMSITKKYGGTGLGLAISKLFVEKMNGTIGVESIDMIGSTFWFTLPLKKQEEKKESHDLPCKELSELKVLVTTDGLDLGKNFEKNLNELKIDYKLALDETQAVKMLNRAFEEDQPFHLVIMEAKESDTPAEHIGRQIKQDADLKQTRLMLLTSIGKQGDARRFEEIGFSAFLSKPVEKSLLQDCIKAVIEGPDAGIDPALPIITRYSIIETKKHLRLILIVEDMETNLLTAKVLIGKQGYKTDEAKNGLEAVEKYQKNHYDLILMDCQMPVLDGFEATRRIRENEKNRNLAHTPIIAMTGNAFDSDKQKCFEAGMDDFIAKPVDPETLARKISSNLADIKTNKGDSPGEQKEKTGFYGDDSPKKALAESDPLVEEDLSFDRKKLLERFGGDEEAALIILDSFFQEAPEFLEKIGDAINKKDMEEVRCNSHALKGAAANVNAERLKKTALEMENKAKNGNPDSFVEIYPTLQNEYQRFMREANHDKY
ncbi:MAG: hypothetical protein A2277_19045 [Desulfobacterales bacterium RIFOXYA12_FULL_46_15]|nr:MAG: hypothetical protein A2277_19045 [Desulfobacterales bacterium RIFOXYA12_FULL_46_15]